MEDYMLSCYSNKYFGVQCPGCGGQRALAFLLDGEFVKAFFMYPPLYPLIVLFLLVGVNLFVKFKNFDKIISILAIINLIVITANYAYHQIY